MYVRTCIWVSVCGFPLLIANDFLSLLLFNECGRNTVPEHDTLSRVHVFSIHFVSNQTSLYCLCPFRCVRFWMNGVYLDINLSLWVGVFAISPLFGHSIMLEIWLICFRDLDCFVFPMLINPNRSVDWWSVARWPMLIQYAKCVTLEHSLNRRFNLSCSELNFFFKYSAWACLAYISFHSTKPPNELYTHLFQNAANFKARDREIRWTKIEVYRFLIVHKYYVTRFVPTKHAHHSLLFHVV